MARVRPTIMITLALLLSSGLLSAQLKKGYHENSERGYKVKPPEKWKEVPVDIDEKWINLKYIAHRSYPSKSTGGELRPQMRVIIFPHDAHKESGVSVRERGGRTEVDIDQRAYRDYKEYVKRNQEEAGFYFTVDKEAKHAGVSCMEYEVKLEKMAGIPRRYVAWVFKGTDADYAVEFECLEDMIDDHRDIALKSLRTFEFIERSGTNQMGRATGSGPTGSTTASDIDPFSYLDRPEWLALPKEERIQRKKDIEKRRWEASKEAVTSGWKALETKSFNILTHADPKYTKQIAEAAEACWSWLESEFGEVSDEHVMRNIIRICADREEARAYVRGSGDGRSFDPKDREIVIWKDASLGTAGGWENLYYYLLNRYLADKDILLYLYLPPWLNYGLDQVVTTADPKGKSLELKSEPDESLAIRIAEKKDALPTVRELMEMTPERFNDGEKTIVNVYMAAKWIRWLMGPGQRVKETKGLVLRYIQGTIAVGSDQEQERRSTTTTEASTEAEEEAQVKARGEAAKLRAQETIKRLHASTCAWTDAEWERFDKLFKQSLKTN